MVVISRSYAANDVVVRMGFVQWRKAPFVQQMRASHSLHLFQLLLLHKHSSISCAPRNAGAAALPPVGFRSDWPRSRRGTAQVGARDSQMSYYMALPMFVGSKVGWIAYSS